MEQGQTTQQERFYLLVGVGGLMLIAASWFLRRQELSVAAQLLHLLGVLVVCAWSAAGVLGARRREREAREAALSRAATERAMAEVMARRTTSHAGMTIKVHKVRAKESDGA